MQAVKLFYESPESKEGVAAFRENGRRASAEAHDHRSFAHRDPAGRRIEKRAFTDIFSAANAWFLGFLGYRPAHFSKLGRRSPPMVSGYPLQCEKPGSICPVFSGRLGYSSRIFGPKSPQI
jgi:hypothetical protein